MKNCFIYEINMWRWLLGVPIAATAIIAVFIIHGRFVLPFIISLITIYLLIAEVYIPQYYSAFDFKVLGRAVTVTKGFVIKSHTITPLDMPLVFERVWVFPFCAFGVCFLVFRSCGTLITIPFMATEKINKMVEDIENAKN